MKNSHSHPPLRNSMTDTFLASATRNPIGAILSSQVMYSVCVQFGGIFCPYRAIRNSDRTKPVIGMEMNTLFPEGILDLTILPYFTGNGLLFMEAPPRCRPKSVYRDRPSQYASSPSSLPPRTS